MLSSLLVGTRVVSSQGFELLLSRHRVDCLDFLLVTPTTRRSQVRIPDPPGEAAKAGSVYDFSSCPDDQLQNLQLFRGSAYLFAKEFCGMY